MYNLCVSSTSIRSEYPLNYNDWDLDKHKIKLFKEQIQGWQLDITRYLLFGDDSKGIPSHPHSAFAALSILVSYFENIARYIEGCTNDDYPGIYFKKGIRYVYKDLSENNASMIYKQLRCGLHHIGISKSKVILSEGPDTGISFINDFIYIAPTKFFIEVANHFNEYCKSLETNQLLRINFENRFNWTKKN